jgi:hypothetical protein
MTDKPGLSNEAIRALLERRAGQPDTSGHLAVVRAVAAATPQRRGGRFAWVAGRMPTLVGAAGLTALALVLVVVGLASRTSSSGTPAGSPAAASSSLGPNLSPLPSEASGPIVLTADELNGLIAADPKAVIGQQLVIHGLIQEEYLDCTLQPGATPCGTRVFLAGSNPDLVFEASEQLRLGAASITLPRPQMGTFAVVVVDDHTLGYEGLVAMSSAGDAFVPSQLPDPSNAGSGVERGYWLVDGWISGLGVTPSCPSIPPPASTAPPQYSCGGTGALLSDGAQQPVTITSGGFSVNGGAGSVLVQNGAYQEFAPAPVSNGLQTRPEEATFLVEETYASTCPESTSCGIDLAGYHWGIVARVDPFPVVVAPPTPSPSPAASSEPVLPLTVEHLTAVLATAPQSLLGRQLVITGELVYPTPVSSCSGAVAGCHDRVVLLGSQPVVRVVPSAFATLPGSLPFRGTFAATLNDATTLQYEGIVATAPDGGPISPSQLPQLGPLAGADTYWLVKAWIAGLEAALPCPIAIGGSDTGPQYGCGRNASLSDTESQPVADLQLTVPADGVQVQNDAYDNFAPDPRSIGYQSQPEQATFLIKANHGSCPPGFFCPVFTGPHWQIVARIDPWPLAAEP